MASEDAATLERSVAVRVVAWSHSRRRPASRRTVDTAIATDAQWGATTLWCEKPRRRSSRAIRVRLSLSGPVTSSPTLVAHAVYAKVSRSQGRCCGNPQRNLAEETYRHHPIGAPQHA